MKKNHLLFSMVCALFALALFSSCEKESNVGSIYRFGNYEFSSTSSNNDGDIYVLETFISSNGLAFDRLITGNGESDNRVEAIRLFDEKVSFIDSQLESIREELRYFNPEGATLKFIYQVKTSYNQSGGAFKEGVKTKEYTIAY